MMVAVRDTFPRHPDVSCEPLKKDSAADKKTATVKAAGIRVRSLLVTKFDATQLLESSTRESIARYEATAADRLQPGAKLICFFVRRFCHANKVPGGRSATSNRAFDNDRRAPPQHGTVPLLQAGVFHKRPVFRSIADEVNCPNAVRQVGYGRLLAGNGGLLTGNDCLFFDLATVVRRF